MPLFHETEVSQLQIWAGIVYGLELATVLNTVGFNKEGVDKLALTSYKSRITTEMELGWKWHSVKPITIWPEITLYQIDMVKMFKDM